MDLSVDIDGRAVLEPAAGDVPLVAVSARGSEQPQDSASLHPDSVSKINHLPSTLAFLLNAHGVWSAGSQPGAGSPGTPFALLSGSGINTLLHHYGLVLLLLLFCCFVLFCCGFEAGSSYVSLTNLRLTMNTRLALNTKFWD